MNDIKLIDFLLNQPIIFIVFGIVVNLLTSLLKKPIKKYTAKIQDDKKRKLINKWILLIPLILSLIIISIYDGIINKKWFSDIVSIISEAISVSMLSIVIYNIFEGIRGGKTEYEITEEGKQVFQLLLVYANDREKVKMFLDQCKEYYKNGNFAITDKVKEWLPEKVNEDMINMVVKLIKEYFDKTNGNTNN